MPGYLENIRRQHGSDRCIEAFEQACRQGRGAGIVNDRDISFPTIYILYSSILPRQRFLSLNQRNRLLLRMISGLKNDETGNGKIDILRSPQPMTKSILFWALKTGCRYQGSDNYDLIMDTIACVLLGTYREKNALPYVEQLIFDRNRWGKNNHDLIWAYFSLHDPAVLKSMSEHLLSEDESEKTLAGELLDTEHICKGCRDARSGYREYQKWLSENDSYLYATVENLQYSRKPQMFHVDEDRKFLQKKAQGYSKQPLENLTEKEKGILREFRSLPPAEREAVSCFSQSVMQTDPEDWERWAYSPLEEKLEKAKKGMEELV